METKTTAVLCAASLAIGFAAGVFAVRGRLDEELREAVAAKDKLVAEMGSAAAAVKASSVELEAINRKMSAAAGEAGKAASDLAGKATSIEVMVGRLKAYAQDARRELAELSRELGAAVSENRAQVERLTAIIGNADGSAPGR